MSMRILRLPQVLALRGVSRSTHYWQIKCGLFTKPVHPSERCSGWPDHEVEALNAARVAGKGENEIRALVVALEAARGGAA